MGRREALLFAEAGRLARDAHCTSVAQTRCSGCSGRRLFDRFWSSCVVARGEPQPALLYLPITRCALVHSLRDSVNVFAGLYCFTVQLCAFTFTRRLIST